MGGIIEHQQISFQVIPKEHVVSDVCEKYTPTCLNLSSLIVNLHGFLFHPVV